MHTIFENLLIQNLPDELDPNELDPIGEHVSQEPVMKVTLTPDLRVIAIDHLNFALGALDPRDKAELEVAFQNAQDDMVLRSSYRIEADMIVVLANALRARTYAR